MAPTPVAAVTADAPATAEGGGPTPLAERLRTPLQVAFTSALALVFPFVVYVFSWRAGFDLTTVSYPVVAVALAATAAVMWAESCCSLAAVEPPAAADGPLPAATAIVTASLPADALTVGTTVITLLEDDDPGDLQVVLAYSAPPHLELTRELEELAENDARFVLLRSDAGTSTADNVRTALTHARGEIVGVFAADQRPAPGSFARAWRWLSRGHDAVQGHGVVRNGETSWVARLVAVDVETLQVVSHPGRARLHGFGVFGGANRYWRRSALESIQAEHDDRALLTGDVDPSTPGLQGLSVVSDRGLVASELAQTTVRGLWRERMRLAHDTADATRRQLGPALTSERLGVRRKLGALILLGWSPLVPWITIQFVPILAFAAWRDAGLGSLDWLVPLVVLLALSVLSAGVFQVLFAALRADARIRRHRWWFALYAFHLLLWFGALQHLVVRVAQLKALTGERAAPEPPRLAAPRGSHVLRGGGAG